MISSLLRPALFTMTSLVLCIALACNGGGRPDIANSTESLPAGELGNDNDASDTSATGAVQVIGVPDGRTTSDDFEVIVSSLNFTGFIYKYGPAEEIRCAENGGYSTQRAITEPISIRTSAFEDGFFKLCIIGIDAAGKRQDLTQALQAVWIKEKEPLEQEEIEESLIANNPVTPQPANVLSANPYVINCNQESISKARNSLNPRNVIMANPVRDDGSDTIYRIYWLNYEGERVFFVELNPGYQILIRGFETHPWVIADTNDNCKGIYTTIQDDVFIIDLK